MDASTFAVARLKLRGTTGTGPAVRLRAANELEAADLMPAGLSPASVLVVRRLADPLPRRFGTPHRRPRPDWERAVRGALEVAARIAARPDARGRLDASASAVLFEDEAQLVACLVADRAHGRIAANWWWPSVLPRLNLPPGAAFGGSRDPGAILTARPREAPAVLSTIERWQEIPAIARALTVASANVVLRSIAATHGLPAAMVEEWLQFAINRRDEAGPGDGPDQRRTITTGAATPWEPWLPLAVRGCATAPEIQMLLGVACGLHAAPAQLRAATVALRTERARPRRLHRDSTQRRLKKDNDTTATIATRIGRADKATATDARTTVPAQTAGRMASAARLDGAASAISITHQAPGDALAHRDPDAPRARKAGRKGSDLDARKAAALPADAAAPIASQLGHVDAPGDRGAPAPPPARTTTSSRIVDAAVVPALTVPVRPNALATTGITTRLGGIFYLIHVLERLELPTAFDPAWAIGAAAGSWGTLDLIARALLGSSFPARDGAWDALAELAGWGAGPARRFRSRFADGASDPAWVAPSGWLAELQDPFEQIAWSHAGSRVCLWSREGYLLAHRRTRGDAAVAARRARRRYGTHATGPTTIARRPAGEIPWLAPALLPPGCPPRLGRWAAAAAPAVLRRLRLALGHDTASAAEVLQVPARIFVTSSHVDVVFTLGDINLQVRRAGLDRNPGWLPAFGRVVYFHFE